MRRGAQPACTFGRRFLLRYLNMRRIRDDACIFRPLRQRRLPASSTGCGRRRCPCSASPVSAAGSGSAAQPTAPSLHRPQDAVAAAAGPSRRTAWRGARKAPMCFCKKSEKFPAFRYGSAAPARDSPPYMGVKGPGKMRNRPRERRWCRWRARRNPRRPPPPGVLTQVPEWASTTAIAQLIGRSTRRVQQLTQDGGPLHRDPTRRRGQAVPHRPGPSRTTWPTRSRKPERTFPAAPWRN